MKANAAETNIHLRVNSGDRDLIDRAAWLAGANRSRFMLDAALREARKLFREEGLFVVDPDAFDRLVEALDNPPAPNEALKKFLAEKPAWEK